MAQDVHQAIAEGLAEELTPIPGHQWTAYRRYHRYGHNGDYDPTGHWNVELVTRPHGLQHPIHIIVHLILEAEAIFTSQPRTVARARFDYHDPQLVENIDQHAHDVLALMGRPA